MKQSRIPSIGGLTSFVAAAEHGSFTSAARKLNLSQGAVSRQIREIEDQLGIRLFDRIRQRVVLTQAGKLYLSHVKKPLEELAGASRKVAAFADGSTLNLVVLPTFATRWLMPRLPGFQKANPGVMIHLTTLQPEANFCAEPFDVAILHCPPERPDIVAQHLMDMDLVAVCSPKLKAKHTISTPADITKFPLLHLLARPNRWAEWLAQAGVEVEVPLGGHSYQNSSMVAQAAVAGLGIALMPRLLFKDELDDNRLEIVDNRFPRAEISYYLAVAHARADCKAITAFAQWITREAQASRSGDDCRPQAKRRHRDEPRDRTQISDRLYPSPDFAG